ncbi:MAG: hypothetical protein IKW77_03105 [Salinivirgaceae bacterium]|nr:hypothetical protein [Salinivirgaceae bacterium]
MRKFTSFIAALMISVATFAQAPQGFSYQAVVRDAQNAVVANKNFNVTLVIMQGETADAAKDVYTETHSVTTNQNGLITLTVGGGKTTDDFSAIDWSRGNYFIKTESDFASCTTQLLSVPFALYAAQAGSANVDLSEYAKKADILAIPTVPTKISAFENDANYALKTEIPNDANLSGYYSKAEVDALLANLCTGTGDNTVSVTAGDNGTVKGASGKFFSGQSLTYTATPNSGYYFSGWSDGYSDNPRTIIIYSDINIAAQFAQNPLVTVTAGSNGSVGGSTNGRYAPGSNLSFTATPYDGYYFNQWSDGYTSNPRYINVYRNDITLEAQFSQNPLVTVTAGSNGSVSGSTNGRYAPGSYLSFTATPSDGYYFNQWSDGNTANPRYINVYRSDITLEAEFVQNPLVTVTAGSNGSVNTSVNGRYAPGSNVTITATPNSGYYFSQWSDGNTDNPRTITIGTSNVTLSAEFVAATIATVDLGLTSGNLWATCNVGAINPWNYGNYYAWGETETKANYDWSTYKYCLGTSNSLTKYCNNINYGLDANGYYSFTDALTTLESTDDAATAVFGSDYSMPTIADWNELSNQCYWVWTSNYNEKNVSGYIVYRAKSDGDKGVKVYSGFQSSVSYSLSDAHIFLPAAGARSSTNLYNAGSYGEYSSSSLEDGNPDTMSGCLIYGSSVVIPSMGAHRNCGYSVRPIRRTN